VIGSGSLPLKDFQALIDRNAWIEEIELSNYGEPFLNPNLPQMMAYAFGRGVALTCDNGANFNFASQQVIEAAVRFRLRSLTCSIDGASQATYSTYRVRGDFDGVLSNIRRLNEVKRQYGSPFPRLTWQFVVFGHNEHELPKARDLAAELDMAFSPKLSWDPDWSPVVDHARVRRESGLDAANRPEFKASHGVGYLDEICHQLWDAPQINWDGTMLGCCRNFWGDFGSNVLTDGLLESINSERMAHAREMLRGRAAPRADIPCTNCQVYVERRRTAAWVAL